MEKNINANGNGNTNTNVNVNNNHIKKTSWWWGHIKILN
jgi:hypothetical protein